MLTSSIVFLGGSQTFLGVLATIIVMCVLKGDSNFIFKILTLIKEQMAENLKNVSADVNFDRLHNDSDYKLLRVLLGNKKQLTPQQIEEGVTLLNDVNIWKSSFQIESAKPDLQGIDHELTLAPLYTFLFVLVVFFFDEFLRSDVVPFNDFLVSVLTFFTLLSSVYWLGQWVTYCFDIFHNDGKRTYTLLSDSRYSFFMQQLHNSLLRKSLVRHLLESLWFLIVLLVLWIAGIQGPSANYMLTAIGVVTPIAFEGLFHLYPVEIPEIKKDQGYRTTLNHFGRFFLFSLILSVVYAFLSHISVLDGLLLPYDNLRCLKVFTIGFVILNGLFIPSFIPYQTYRYLSDAVLNKPNRIQKKVNKDIDLRLKKIRQFTIKYKID